MTLGAARPLAEAKGKSLMARPLLIWFADEARDWMAMCTSNICPKSQRILTIKQPIGVGRRYYTRETSYAERFTRKAGSSGLRRVVPLSSNLWRTPFAALALAELAHQAGIPAGVLNVVWTKTQKHCGVCTGILRCVNLIHWVQARLANWCYPKCAKP